MTCCPLSDGYDYAFHTHYVRAWERMVDCVKEAAAHRPEITLFMEYKPSETRVHCLLDSAAKAILLCDAVGANVGVTIDTGHSIYGGETPAEALAHVAMSGHPYYVHINDNNGKWDWDLMVGTCNLWGYVEFLYYLKELGYDGWITSDTSPVRQDAIETFAFNVRMTDRIWSWLDRIDRAFIREHLERHQVHADHAAAGERALRRIGAARRGEPLVGGRRTPLDPTDDLRGRPFLCVTPCSPPSSACCGIASASTSTRCPLPTSCSGRARCPAWKGSR